MNDQPADSQLEKDENPEQQDSLVRIEDVENWDSVLLPATRPETIRTPPPQRPGGFQATAIWLKLLFPLLIVAGYVLFKVSSWERPLQRETALTVRDSPNTLTGVRPAQEETLVLDRATREVVAKLEAFRNRNEWRQAKELVEAETREEVRKHPVVQGFHLLARTRLGERSRTIEDELVNVEGRLRPEIRRYGDLIHGLRLARIDQILSRTRNPIVLQQYTDLFTMLLERTPRDHYDVSIRLKLAERYERAADDLAKEAKGIFRTDVVKTRQARSYYQIALRWIVAPDGWLDLVAISPAARPEVERLVEKIRQTNRTIHGVSLPLTESDSNTWVGRRGTPIHDIPGGSY